MSNVAATTYEPVIGVEIHVQLQTASKMFCGCAAASADAPPNSHTCPVCLGLPGALPVINRRAVELVLATGRAIGASTPEVTRWDRKNYFYPDLPKGYQISQFDLPLAANGRLAFETADGPLTVGIRRAHLEEDTARLVHATDADGRRVSLVDFNRSGLPLMEVVTEPDLRSAEQARRYAEELRAVLVAIGASAAAMEEGQMRVEANVSLRPVGDDAFGTRVEIKNMNSFRSVERAIEFEITRQTGVLDAGDAVAQETRGWDDDHGRTYVMRSKEDSHDYRYFPEPDLPPLRADPSWLADIAARLPELPAARRARYRDDHGLTAYDAGVLVAEPGAAAVYEAAVAAQPSIAPKTIANWVTGEYLRLAKQTADDARTADALAVDGAQLGQLIRMVADGELSATNAKQVFERHALTGEAVGAIVDDLGLRAIDDREVLAAVIDDVLAANPDAVADIRSGKGQATGFIVGQVMKATRGQAQASTVQALVRERLGLD
jgi:aspartyl-tRNA(Asn)/glutamyl-tRNA(Gln) amidotransferase subunit B